MNCSANTLDQLKADLVDQAGPLLLVLFGQPTRRLGGGREWRWGSKGGVAYRFDRNQFFDFQQDPRAHSLLDAIMFRNGCSFLQAITWAQSWLGNIETRPTPREMPRPAFNADAEQQFAIAEARALWRAGLSIVGTAAAKYLEGRAIDKWPADAVRIIAARDVAQIVTSTGVKGRARKRWTWWRWLALMFPLTNDAGDVRAVQLVALYDDGSAVKHWEHGGKIKVTRGPKAGVAFRMPGNENGPLVLTEGGETGLSPWLATGHETWAMLGAIGSAPLNSVPIDRTIIVARDDDPSRSPSRIALRKAIAKRRAEGRRVVEVQPWLLSRGDKTDFNNVLQQLGPDAVRERFNAALTPMVAPQGKPRLKAVVELAGSVRRTFGDLLDTSALGAPAFKVIRASLGLGKSEETLLAIFDSLRDAVEAACTGKPIVYSVPMHKLTGEIAGRARAMAVERGSNINVRIWYGRSVDDPGSNDAKMCLDLEAVELARTARLNVSENVCANCEHRSGCSYIAQTQATADLWLVPHALLFAALPDTMRAAALLVIDEGIALSGLSARTLVRFDNLDKAVMRGRRPKSKKSARPPKRSDLSDDLNVDLMPIHRKLLDADHVASPDGEPLRREVLASAGIDAAMADKARSLHNKRIRGLNKLDAPTRDDLVRALKHVTIENQAAAQAASVWEHIRDFLTDADAVAAGRVDVVELEDGTRALRLFVLDKLGDGWRTIPTLHLDATADMDLLRRRFPHSELVADIAAAEPHATVHQVVGNTFGCHALGVRRAKDAGGEWKTGLAKTDLAEDVRRDILSRVSALGGRALVIAPKALALHWRTILPAHVAVEWFGNLRGIDAYGDVHGLFVVGRWGVRPNTVGRLAAVLSGRAVERLPGKDWYPTETITLQAADSTSRTVDADRHPNALAEAVRKALVVGELLQGTGRGRGVQRGPAMPLSIVVYGNTPLPLPLATLSDWQPVDFDRAMLADYGAMLSAVGDAATVTGRTAKAVEHHRARLPPCPYKEILLYGHGGDLPVGLAIVTYQRAGAGRAEQRMIFDPARIADPRAWLEARLGPLVHFNGVDLPDTIRQRDRVQRPENPPQHLR
ncbi:DUF7146 domain-containing protein [Reyranella sp.]|uniref:DUF7146 domain-containing protein n=1 Tax=Reyranella sp. TaxID=1929291 RepID=UPI003D0B48A6